MKIEIFIIDANVLIDFCKTDKAMLKLVSDHIADVRVAEPVLDEVEQLDRAEAVSLGMGIVMPDFACLSEAARLAHRSPLRLQDWICLLLAETHRWTCVTNDKRLRLECQDREVAILWGLELLLRLVSIRKLSVSGAIALAEAMHQINKRLPRKIVDAFVRKVKAVRR